jgi:tetratricopeptide (TPR) repeat protein
MATLWFLLALAFAWPAGSSPQLVEDLVHIKFQTDVRIFAVMAAVNLAGFDLEAADLTRNPVRKLVRERLSGARADLRERLQKFYDAHNSAREESGKQNKYVSLALLLKGPPQFALQAKPAEMPPDVLPLVGFENLLEELWKEGELAALWEQVRPEYAREAEACRPLLRSMIIETLGYMRMEARVALDRELIFIPDLLNGYGVVNARNIENNYVVIVGPSRTDERPMRSLRHEYLHFLIDPLIAKYFSYLPAAEPYLKRLQEQLGVLERYKRDFTLMATESLIQMMEFRLDRESGVHLTEKMVKAYGEGLLLAPYFEENLLAFEKRQDSFQEFFPGLIKGIRSEVESNRDASIAQLSKEIESRPKAGGGAQSLEPFQQPELRSLLNQANQLLVGKDFDKAAPLLERVLRIDALNASALFGMAQIASQAQDFERALALYEQAAANAGAEAWIAGWSWVHRGDIYQFLGDSGRAQAEWSRVSKLQGNLRGAAEAAKKSMSRPNP